MRGWLAGLPTPIGRLPASSSRVLVQLSHPVDDDVQGLFRLHAAALSVQGGLENQVEGLSGLSQGAQSGLVSHAYLVLRAAAAYLLERRYVSPRSDSSTDVTDTAASTSRA